MGARQTAVMVEPPRGTQQQQAQKLCFRALQDASSSSSSRQHVHAAVVSQHAAGEHVSVLHASSTRANARLQRPGPCSPAPCLMVLLLPLLPPAVRVCCGAGMWLCRTVRWCRRLRVCTGWATTPSVSQRPSWCTREWCTAGSGWGLRHGQPLAAPLVPASMPPCLGHSSAAQAVWGATQAEAAGHAAGCC